MSVHGKPLPQHLLRCVIGAFGLFGLLVLCVIGAF